MLISCVDVFQPKRHNLVAEGAPLCDEDGFLHIFRFHLDLIITRETIHEREYLMLSGVVDQNINVRKWEIIFGACPVQILVVYAHMHLSIFLW